jgi:signal transduction histidine kinase
MLDECIRRRLGPDGLGLSIARKAVRAHGGEIHIRNMPGKGCVFVIDVPLAADESVPQAVVQP